MSFNPPVPQQDSNWEIRLAVLLSLFLQILLIFLGPVRRRSSALWSRLTVWSCYLFADWVADLALGLILNNLGNIGGGGGSGNSSSSSFGLKRGGATASNSNASGSSSTPTIFAFWTPFLLLHLGGPDTITAYSVEDNELWLRHLIGLLFELFSAGVIFLCSLHGNPLIHATVLMFVVGTIKYGERTYSLYCGSQERFRSNILGPPVPGRNYARFMTEFDSKKKAGLAVEITIPNGEASIARNQMEKQETQQLVLDLTKSMEARAYEFFLIFRRLFVNLILSSKEQRLSRQAQAFFLERRQTTATEAFEVIEVELNFIYDMVYTKAPAAYTRTGWVLRCICSACLVSVLLIFLSLDKPGHQIQRVDVVITYALLLGGLALDLVALLVLLFSNRTKVYLEEAAESSPLRWFARACLIARAVIKRWRPRRWSGTVAQFNLISYCLGVPDSYGGILRGCCLMATKMLGTSSGLAEFPLLQDFIFIHHRSLRHISYRNKFCSCLRRCVREKLIKPLVPVCKCCDKSEVHDEVDEMEDDEVDNMEDLLLLTFIFHGLKGSAHKLEDKKPEDYKKEIMEVSNRRGKGVVERFAYKIKKAFAYSKEVEQLAMDIIKKKSLSKAGDDVHKLVKAEVVEQQFNLIMDSVEKNDFDESLLLWHIATDLCRFRANEWVGDVGETVYKRPVGPLSLDTAETRAIAETLSEYMLYLLVKQPEMLSARTGIWLMRYRDTCEEARRFFGYMAAWNPDHDDARRMLLRVNTSEKPSVVKGDDNLSVLFDAVILAKALLELDEVLMWDLITGVWGEMLTYAAGKCPGSTHLQQLNRGGEFITHIWLLMEHMGVGNIYNIKKVDTVAKIIVHDH